VTSDNRAKQGPLVTDGTRIYMTELLPGWRQILVEIPKKGGETAPFATSLKEPHVQDISPDGSELLLVADQGPGLWIVPVAGGSPRRVGTFTAYDASWHPDGETIIYSTGHEVSIVKKDGTLKRNLLRVDGYVSRLRFSPDGQRFSFTLIDEAHQSTSLWEASADGSNLHPLLPGWNNPAKECCGTWTADGRYLIFQSERD
jgi:Tol biopolymer transport system component